MGIYGLEPCADNTIELLESELDVKLPDDFKSIARFYSGGILGGISHHAIATGGPATNIRDETIRLRRSVALPRTMVVLESLITLETDGRKTPPAVIWCDAVEVSKLDNIESLTNPESWSSYEDFFEWLLDCEDDDRRGQHG